jgi:hypothetical protein
MIGPRRAHAERVRKPLRRAGSPLGAGATGIIAHRACDYKSDPPASATKRHPPHRAARWLHQRQRAADGAITSAASDPGVRSGVGVNRSVAASRARTAEPFTTTPIASGVAEAPGAVAELAATLARARPIPPTDEECAPCASP